MTQFWKAGSSLVDSYESISKLSETLFVICGASAQWSRGASAFHFVFSLSFCTRPREQFVKQRLYIPIGWDNEKNGRLRRSIWCTQNPQLVISIPQFVRNVCKLTREKFLPAYFEVDHWHMMWCDDIISCLLCWKTTACMLVEKTECWSSHLCIVLQE